MKRFKKASKGQNLVEMALVFPFLLAFILFTMEMGNVWYTYEAAKMAAMEGAQAASMYHNPLMGRQALQSKASASGITLKKGTVTQVPEQHAYQADITVSYSPFFGGLSIPSLGGDLTLIPGSFDISYTAIRAYAVY